MSDPNQLKTAIKTYAPENDSEALAFIDQWCKNCTKVKRDNNGEPLRHSCDILHTADQVDQCSKAYPIEWQRNSKNKGTCTAFNRKKPTEVFFCRTCQNPLPEQTGAGRKRDYCADQPCAEFEKHRAAMLRASDQINFSTESNKEIRGDMFRYCNELRQREV